MNVNQKKIFTLLSEIADICVENQIPYFYSGRTAVRAFLTQSIFYERFLDVEVVIPVWKAKCFLHAVEQKNNEARMVESLLNNDDFPGFYLYYTDLESTMLRYNDGESIKNPGFFVKISFLRNIPKDASKMEAERLERLILETSPLGYDVEKIIPEEEIALYRKEKETGKVGANVFEKLVDIYSTENHDEVGICGPDGEMVAFEAGRFEETNLLVEEDLLGYIPTDEEEFLQKLCGSDYANRASEIIHSGALATMVVEGANCIVNADVPFAVFLPVLEKYGIDREYFEMRKAKDCRAIFEKECADKMARIWEWGSRAGDLWEMHDHYFPLKGKINSLFSIRQLNELKKEFEPYDSTVRKYEALGLAWRYDDELWDIYRYLLRAYKEDEFADRLEQLALEDNIFIKQLDRFEALK